MQFIVELCDTVSFSPRHSDSVQKASDNDVAYFLKGVNACISAAGGGQNDSADVSTE